MADEFPFLFFGHGPLSSDAMDKCEEVFIWFSRPVTLSERKQIVASCPPPLAAFSWGDCFAYFGSPGDSYDFLVADTYRTKKQRDKKASKKKKIEEEDFSEYADFENFYEAFDTAIPAFCADLERWALATHELVPIVFLQHPHGADPPSEWSEWSDQNAGRALEAMQSWQKENPWVEQGESAGAKLVEPAPEKAVENVSKKVAPPKVDKYLVESLPRSRVAEFYGWILNRITRMAFEAASPETKRKLLEEQFQRDELIKPFGRLSYEESRLHQNAGLVSQYLGSSKGTALSKLFEPLLPWTRLVYLCSYDAQKKGIFDTIKDVPAYIAKLVDQLPAERSAVATTMIAFLADNIAHLTPAYSKPAKDKADEALPLYALARKRKDAEASVYLHAAACHEWKKELTEALSVIEEGLARFPQSAELIDAGVSLAGRSKNKAAISRFTELAKKFKKTPNEKRLLDETFALVQAAKFKQALEAIHTYLENGGLITPKVATNYSYILRYGKPPEKALEEGMNRLEKAAMDSDEVLLNTDAMANVISVLNEHGRAKQAHSLMQTAASRGIPWDAALLCNFAHCLWVLKEHEGIKQLLDRPEAKIDRVLTLPGTPVDRVFLLGNLAEIATIVGRVDDAFAYLGSRLSLDPDPKALLEDGDLKPLHSDPRWTELFPAKEEAGEKPAKKSSKKKVAKKKATKKVVKKTTKKKTVAKKKKKR